MEIKIGDRLWHPCELDVIEHKVIGILQYEDFTHIQAKAVDNVGACGRVEVLLHEQKGRLRFVSLYGEEELPYASGLHDFVEGLYYKNEQEAKAAYYRIHKLIAWGSMDAAEKRLKEAKAYYEKISRLLDIANGSEVNLKTSER